MHVTWHDSRQKTISHKARWQAVTTVDAWRIGSTIWKHDQAVYCQSSSSRPVRDSNGKILQQPLHYVGQGTTEWQQRRSWLSNGMAECVERLHTPLLSSDLMSTSASLLNGAVVRVSDFFPIVASHEIRSLGRDWPMTNKLLFSLGFGITAIGKDAVEWGRPIVCDWNFLCLINWRITKIGPDAVKWGRPIVRDWNFPCLINWCITRIGPSTVEWGRPIVRDWNFPCLINNNKANQKKTTTIVHGFRFIISRTIRLHTAPVLM